MKYDKNKSFAIRDLYLEISMVAVIVDLKDYRLLSMIV
jgi:hypothetical protein